MTMMFSAQKLGWIGKSGLDYGVRRKWVRSKEVRPFAGEQESYM